jgi:hypothetical protein
VQHQGAGHRLVVDALAFDGDAAFAFRGLRLDQRRVGCVVFGLGVVVLGVVREGGGADQRAGERGGKDETTHADSPGG